MISEWDIRRVAKRDTVWFSIDDNDRVIDKKTGETVCDISVLLQVLREKLHCNFEVVYECHPLLEVILRCKQCGTVIFASEDIEDCEQNLRCPTCSNYRTSFKYWTKEQIENDQEKKEIILDYEKMYAEDIAAIKRRKSRGGKYDWEIGKCSFKIPGKKKINLELECDNLFKHKLRGLRLQVSIWKKYKDSDIGYIRIRKFYIPLSWSYVKIMIRIRKKRRKEENL